MTGLIRVSSFGGMQVALLLCASALWTGCARPASDPPQAPQRSPSSAVVLPASALPPRAVAPSSADPSGSTPAMGLGSPWLFISDAAALRALERRGYDFASVALGASVPAPDESAADYARRGSYRDWVDVVVADLREFMRSDPRLGVGMRHAHRSFDPAWLSSRQFRFELAGIVNRIDRRVFAPETCGEIRFIYRLAYAAQVRGQEVASRVPMTINAVRWLASDGAACSQHVQRWRIAEASGEPLAEALLRDGQLLHGLLAATRVKSLEANLQSVRWPSTVRPNMAGHAEYLLRVFTPVPSSSAAELRYLPAGLENTPDVALLERLGPLRRGFVDWLRDAATLSALDQGTLAMPERFLAKRAVSVAPHGLSRLANRPASRLVHSADLAGLDLSTFATFKNPEQLRRRLDGLSCSGCHQTHGVAGFHFLGHDEQTRRADVIAVEHSRHFAEDSPRRAAYLASLLAAATPTELRLPVERMGDGDYGAHCGISPVGPFAAWTCDPGLSCLQLDDPVVGVCQPLQRGPGDACEVGKMIQKTDSHRDVVSLSPQLACAGAGVCERNGVGFPGGMCSASCADLSATATCGGIAQLVEFNGCLARQESFESCILGNTRPGALRACSQTQPCREDYICARMPSGRGGCIPPYFLFQMRVDGHVLN